ncbi:MAG: HyaD/HybD family hydrogenase maturation endopeptidase [Candidatus Palauibacterales bacterium]|nr:HyaD/HybD family hydrogenase maturation endopeptidase [Candidatus Palauibacterales bacterium]MDP2529018.1 HyaD/HybD family hydrogenase maturation endopeptidase [Candidatus Palauibacterales bacterium]MDP2583837.1 HyaD/HybD family hydrogenase maturation endopeptidase [Candidatus Palauibacterales bacterium]
MSDSAARGAFAPRAPSGTLVLGLGSPLMADDGVGLEALEALRSGWRFSPPVEMVDGGTWGMNLLGLIEDAERLLLLDAIHAGRPAGSLVVLRGEELPRYLFTKVSPHQIDLREVLALAEFRGGLPADTVAIGLQPERVEMSPELSPIVRDTLPTLVAAAVATLRSWGHRAERVASEDRTLDWAERVRAG